MNISIVGGQRGRGQRQLGSLWGDVEEGLMVSSMQKRGGDKIQKIKDKEKKEKRKE